MGLKFTKMHGLGNDFVVIDATEKPLALTPEQARAIANRQTGVGCDQLLIVEAPDEEGVDFNYRVINRNGSEVGQCGNGARCLARFVHEQGLTSRRELTVKTITTRLRLKIEELDRITVDMGIPVFEPRNIPFLADARRDMYTLDLGDEEISCAVLSMGNPHAVVFVEDIGAAPVDRQGPLIEVHPRFPDHANACFARIVDNTRIQARVHERGVGETMACGSGACAIMVAARKLDLAGPLVDVVLNGGSLSINWAGEGAHVEMTGPAVRVFESKLELENL